MKTDNINMNIDSSASQERMILEALKNGESLTPLEALKRFGCLRLGARIWDLKRKGHKVKKNIIKTASGKRVAQYFI